jgi:hypothetical protein
MAKQNADDLQTQYNKIAKECADLSRRLSASELSRVRQGTTVTLSEDAKRFKELMALKLEAKRELDAAIEAKRGEMRKKLDDARRMLESAGEIQPRSELHAPERNLEEVA